MEWEREPRRQGLETQMCLESLVFLNLCIISWLPATDGESFFLLLLG